MYLVYSQNPAGSCVSFILTISPLFPIHFPLFQSHSCCLRCLSVAGHVTCCQLSSQVSYKSFSAIASPVWLECPIRQSAFPCFRSRNAPPPANPLLLVSRSRIVGTQRISDSSQVHIQTGSISCGKMRMSTDMQPREHISIRITSHFWSILQVSYNVLKCLE